MPDLCVKIRVVPLSHLFSLKSEQPTSVLLLKEAMCVWSSVFFHCQFSLSLHTFFLTALVNANVTITNLLKFILNRAFDGDFNRKKKKSKSDAYTEQDEIVILKVHTHVWNLTFCLHSLQLLWLHFFFHIVYPTYVNKIVLIEGRNISLAENPGRIFSLEKGQHIYIFAVLGRIHWSMHWKSAQ